MAERTHRLVVGVMGAASCGEETAALAERVGSLLADRGAVVLCGGRGGVMEAAARGARSRGGLVVGVLPGRDADDSPPNPSVDVAIFTGMGDGRNWVNACSSDAIVAIAGGWGTLSEIALARKIGRPVVLLRSWPLAALDGEAELPVASTAEQAVEMVWELLRSSE